PAAAMSATSPIRKYRARKVIFALLPVYDRRAAPHHITIGALRARARQAMLGSGRTPSEERDAHANRREPRQEDAESQRVGAVHGGQPIAHSEHRDDCGGVRLRRGLYRPRTQPDLARN